MSNELFLHEKSQEEVISMLKNRVNILSSELQEAIEYSIMLEKRLNIYRDDSEIQKEIIDNSTANWTYT